MRTADTDDHTYGFHLVNVGLHGVASALVTEASAFVFDGGTEDDVAAQFITGFIFGLHPVHAEAVSNITSRGELIMSLFFLLAFLTYAGHVPTEKRPAPTLIQSIIYLYVLPWLFMTLSLFSKEQGATALASLVTYDFVTNHSSVREFLASLQKRDARAISFLWRTFVLFLETLAVCGWRYWLNGETSPDFIFDQNPAGFSEDRFTRVFSVCWVYCLYVWDALYPKYLCPDWSGVSIDLITESSDKRIVWVLLIWTFAAGCVFSLVMGPSKRSSRLAKDTRRVVLLAFFAFSFVPFLLSSNLIVVVGLMKADRVIYLPLIGFCLLEALLVKNIFCSCSSSKTFSAGRIALYWTGHLLVLLQLMLFAMKLHERNVAWSNSLDLWMSAYQINNRSHHTMYNCGYELSLKQRYKEAEQVLRPIGDPRVEGPSNTFVYAMVLFNLDRCEEALVYIDEAMVVLKENEARGGPRNTASSIARTKSNLLVAQAFCTTDIATAGQKMYKAVETDPTNQYAIEQASAMMKRVEDMKKLQGQRMKLGLHG
jgi:hypothetical protein